MSDFITVHSIHWHSPDIFEIRFERDGMTFTAGDCVALYHANGKQSRPYSMASGTGEELLRFVIRRMPGGVLSEWLATRQPGDRVMRSPPFGWFRPGHAEPAESSVFIATGTGIAPFLAYLRSRPEHPPILCLYGVRTLADAVEADWIRARCPLRLAVSREQVPGAHHGRVTALLDDMPVEEGIHYYLCGLDSMIFEITSWLEERGVSPVRIHRECFFNDNG